MFVSFLVLQPLCGTERAPRNSASRKNFQAIDKLQQSQGTRSQFTFDVRIPLAGKIPMRQLRGYGLWFALLYPIWFAPAASAQCSSPANAIVAENCLPGTPQNQWDVSGAGDATIQGFTTDISVNQGQTVSFKISTTATNYKLDIYRLGYYGGAGARLVTTVTPSAHLPQSQPACITDVATALMDCGNWAVSATWTVPSTATSGIYFAHVIRSDTGGDSHIPFVVRNDSSTSADTLQNFGYHVAGLQRLRRCESLYREAGPTKWRLQSQLQPPVPYSSL